MRSNFLLKAGSVKRSDEVAQGFIQLHLENLPGGRLYNLSGQSAPLLDCLHCGKDFLLLSV